MSRHIRCVPVPGERASRDAQYLLSTCIIGVTPRDIREESHAGRHIRLDSDYHM